MQNYGIIIAEPSKNLRTLGRNALKENWRKGILAVLVYTLIISVPTSILNVLFGINPLESYSTYSVSMDTSLYSTLYSSMPEYSFLGSIYSILVTGPLNLGIALFFLAMFRKQIVEVSDIFMGFERFAKAIGLAVYMGIFITLWTLLFIIPGIIAAIRYSQAFFILADDPEKGIRQCMNESKAMMRGNKMKFFCLTISFIGWVLISAIPAAVLNAVSDALALTGVIEALLSVVGSLFVVPVTVYMYATYAGFYEIASGHLIKQTEPAPIE